MAEYTDTTGRKVALISRLAAAGMASWIRSTNEPARCIAKNPTDAQDQGRSRGQGGTTRCHRASSHHFCIHCSPHARLDSGRDWCSFECFLATPRQMPAIVIPPLLLCLCSTSAPLLPLSTQEVCARKALQRTSLQWRLSDGSNGWVRAATQSTSRNVSPRYFEEAHCSTALSRILIYPSSPGPMLHSSHLIFQNFAFPVGMLYLGEAELLC